MLHAVPEFKLVMSFWQQRQAAQQLLSLERGHRRRSVGDRLRVVLAFPNTYYVGMSILGVQTVHHLFNAEDGVSCERVFFHRSRSSEHCYRLGRRC